MGNTWVPEFAALGALEPLDGLVGSAAGIERADFFPGIWATNVVDDTTFGIPWYVDTRVIFYRTDLLARAGVTRPPETWDEWLASMRAIKKLGGPTRWAILLPLDEWTQPVVLAQQQGSTLLADGGRRGAFRAPEFRRAFEFYVSLFREGLAPTLANTQVANLYQDFAAGTFAMYITGPWNLGEFRSRLPADMQDKWATAPLPGPHGADGGLSAAGGASLVLYRASKHKKEAWKLIQYLTASEQQVKFYRLTGDLPARTTSWRDTTLAGPRAAAFRAQLGRVAPLPPVPEIELIVTRVASAVEAAARGRKSIDSALEDLDREVDQILEKRRWMLARRAPAAAVTP
jgi:multiple sugar transport system substrate-binding protein